MAQYTVSHACGHTQTHQLYGKTVDRQSRAEWLATQDCTECYRAAKLAAATKNTAHLPALTGSEKQIAWATTIRAEKVAELDDLAAKCEALSDTVPAAQADAIRNAIQTARNQADAGWWIDNRNCSGRELAQKFHTGA